MKKIKELLKPFISIIFGAILFLFYFNWLGTAGAPLALGIIAVILSVYFLVVGILNVILGDKLGKAKGILNMAGVATYPIFLGVYFLLNLISQAQADAYLGPNGWTIALVSIAASFGLGVLLFIAYFLKNKGIHRVTFLFAAIFVLVLLVDVLITDGFPISLGQIIVLQVVLYGAYVFMLFEVLASFKERKETKKEEEPKEEKPAEEPKEEAKAE